MMSDSSRYSELKSREDVDLNTKFTKKTTLHRTPIVATNGYYL